MASYNKYHYFVGDFETTVYEGQDSTEVWASAIVPFYSENVIILNSISDTLEYLMDLNENIIIYYHNLKFDGHFWLDFILRQDWLIRADNNPENEHDFEFLPKKEMPNNSYTYSISGMGQWYYIVLKINNHIIEIRDSLKLLPFSVKQLGKSFDTQHKKLDMEYTGYRYAGCEISENEKQYIANDVLVVKEALEIMFKEGHNKLTIGACCLDEFKTKFQHPDKENPAILPFDYYESFPNLCNILLDKNEYGSENAEEYIRKSYHGGWCYLVEGKENREFYNGLTLDVNSLYPSVMSSESGSIYPFLTPRFHKCVNNKIEITNNDCFMDKCYYFVRFKCRFYIKEGYLPTVQIKNNRNYKSTEWLKTSDIKGKDGKYYKQYLDKNGNIQDTRIEQTMTMTDFDLFLEHYNVEDFEILDYCTFPAIEGMFDNYINKYKKIKTENKGAKRTLAKLYLNNLYGKMATSPRNDFKLAFLDNDVINFRTIVANNKEPVYIPVGSAVTSYARNFTIRAAQANYYGVNKRGFIYADTDSIHCDLSLSEIKDCQIDDTAFCKWKCESQWTKAIYARQKTYMEQIQTEDKLINDIKCAGMPQRCKDKLEADLQSGKLQYKDFKKGYKVEGKLIPKRIKGGIVLKETTFEMR